MSLTLYSAKSKEAKKLKANGFEISAGEDEKINIIQEDKPDEYPKFNCLYNKAEVDARVVNDYIENGGSLKGFGDVPITEKSTQILEYKALARTNSFVESNRELIRDEYCVNTFNDIIEGESKTCEAIHDMYSELMCAADGYEQVVLEEDKGKCEVVKYVQTHTAPPEPKPTEPFLQYKSYHNLADMLMNIMKNEKRNQNTTRILYEVFNEANWIKFINGTKQYHYNLQDNTLKTIGYKYKNSDEEVKADQLVEVGSPGEFIDIYMQNQKDNYANYPKIIQNLLLSSVLGYELASALKLFTTSLTVDHTIKVDNIDGTKVKVSLNQFLNDVQLNINNIIVSLNYWADYCSKIKSCNCNQEGENNFEDVNDDIFIELFSDLYDRVDGVEDHLQVHDISRLHFDNQVQLAQSQVVDFSIYNNDDGINDLVNQYQNQNQHIDSNIQHTNFMNDRSFNIDHDERYYWSALFHRWVLLTESGYSFDDFPSGWRTNRSFDAPPSFIFDVDRQNWIQIMITDFDNKCQGWRNNEDRMSVAVYTAFMANNTKQKEGDIVWDENENEWIYCNSAVSPLSIDSPSDIAMHSIDIGTPPKQPDGSISIPGSDLESFKKALEVYGNKYIEPPKNYQFNREKPIYGDVNIKANLNVNGLINGVDISNLSSGGDITTSNFTYQSGFPKYILTNNLLSTDTFRLFDRDFKMMVIGGTEEIQEQIKDTQGRINIFKIILRNNIIMNANGKIIKEFYIYAEDGKIYNPILIHNTEHDETRLSYFHETTTNKLYIAHDEGVRIDSYDLYLKGELSIMYLLPQDSLVAVEPTIKCDTIEAKNALKLHNSDIIYLYKPTKITDATIGDKEYYKMIYEIPDDYHLIEGFKFKFKEYCFGNSWELEWKEDKWTGNNLSGRLGGSVINKLNKRNTGYYHNDNRTHLCYAMMKNDDIHNEIIPRGEKGILYSLYALASKEGKLETKLLLNNDEIINGDENHISCWVFEMGGHNKETYEGYDLVGVECRLFNYEANIIKFNELIPKISRVYLDIYLPKSSTPTRLTFKILPQILHVYGQLNGNVDLIGDLDTIDRIACDWTDSFINPEDRNIEIYLRKSMADPFEEMNWDGKMNPFEYIIRQQFYEIYPNPNAATTLYTDYNICSSKIITADNITTMRSDLNLVSNNFDVLSYDFNKLENKVGQMDRRLITVEDKTEHLISDMKSIKIVEGISLAFTIAGGIVGGGLALSSMGITFGGAEASSEVAVAATTITHARTSFLLEESYFSGASRLRKFDPWSRTISDTNKVLEWCDEGLDELEEITFENDFDDPDKGVMTLQATFNLCNIFRDSLKPVFKILANEIKSVQSTKHPLDDIDMTAYITKLEVKEMLEQKDLYIDSLEKRIAALEKKCANIE